ncbi:MAG: cobalamin biosynthesis protein, partial [Pseudomonadota bacterium]|nr:cobalamin biosynthesis protein [Pseudomonadota bacterium]
MDQLKADTPAKPVILGRSSAGLALAGRLAEAIDADIHGHAVRCPDAPHHFGRAKPHIADLFCSGRPVIGICAAGILIRAVAPHLRHKSTDAPVIAVAEGGGVAVPLVGGHHGAITLARRVADAVGATLAITTAGDDRWGIPLDEPPSGWRLANKTAAPRVMPQLLAGDGAFIDGDCLDGLNDWFDNVPRGNAVSLTVTRRQHTPSESELVYCPQDVMLGVGCARGCSADEVIELVMQELAGADINAASIAGVFSVDLKADEPALQALAAMLAVPLRIFDRETLAAEAPRLANPSKIVEEEIGIPGVAEAAA